MMGMAFGITIDDVSTVLQRNGVTDCTDEQLEEILGNIDGDLVAKAALYGADMDEQTIHALDEIEDQLEYQGYIKS